MLILLCDYIEVSELFAKRRRDIYTAYNKMLPTKSAFVRVLLMRVYELFRTIFTRINIGKIREGKLGDNFEKSPPNTLRFHT